MPRGVYKRTKPGYWLGKKRPEIAALKRGIPRSEETRRKIGLAHKGKTNWKKGLKLPHLSGENAPNWKGGLPKCMDCGKQLKNRYSAFCQSCSSKGVRNHNWVSDRNKLVKNEKKHLDGRYREWMRAVKNRDGWKCKISNNDCSGRLEAHHILNWRNHPELRYEVNNGITLCHFHHPLKINDEMRLVPIFRELINEK